MSPALTIEFPKAFCFIFINTVFTLVVDKFTVVSFLEALEDSVATQSNDAMDES